MRIDHAIWATQDRDAEEAAGSPLGRTVVETLASVGEGWMGWAVAVTNAEDVAHPGEPALLALGVGERELR